MTADQLITRMLDVASDMQANMIDDVLVACGYWWACGDHGYFKADEHCDICNNWEGR